MYGEGWDDHLPEPVRLPMPEGADFNEPVTVERRMLAHDFVEMPGRSLEIGDNPHENVMLLRCKWCLKTPRKAREDGCAVHELEEAGQIVLSEWNPDGVEYFKGRTCVTCEMPIMGHWLRRGQGDTYWCHENQNQFSYGVSDCVHDVSLVSAPVEQMGTMGSVQL